MDTDDQNRKGFELVSHDDFHDTSILMVEDNPDHAMLARSALLRNRTWLIEIASTMGEAFEKMRHRSYEVLLVDYCLPDGYGLDLLDWVDEECAVVMMTAQGSEQVAVEAFRRGALDYVVKDALFREVLPEIVEQALAKNRAIRKMVLASGESGLMSLKSAIAYSPEILRVNGYLHTDHLRTIVSKFHRYIAEVRGCLRMIRFNPDEPVTDTQLAFLEAALDNCEQIEDLLAQLTTTSPARNPV